MKIDKLEPVETGGYFVNGKLFAEVDSLMMKDVNDYLDNGGSIGAVIEFSLDSAIKFLNKTDNREYSSYVCKDGEVLEETIAKRVRAREFIRNNK